jgi:hypothetical protein
VKPSTDGTLEKESAHLLGRLATRSWADEAYLAGSAALSLYIGHRRVRDLDFMSASQRLRAAERRDLLGDLLAVEASTRVETARDGFLYLRVDGRAVRFYYYPYPLVDPLEMHRGFGVASAVDLGLMKLGALISRGARRDFIDIFLLSRLIPLSTLLDRAGQKFGHVRDFPLQALKALTDLDLARSEPMPHLDVQIEWDEIEAWIKTEIRDLARSRIALDDPKVRGRNDS